MEMGDASAKRFGSCLKAARRAAGYRSAKAFATEHGINVGTYTAHEQGQRNMTLEQAWQYADMLGCSLDAIAGVEPAPREDPEESRLVGYYAACDVESRELISLTAQRLAGARSGGAQNG